MANHHCKRATLALGSFAAILIVLIGTVCIYKAFLVDEAIQEIPCFCNITAPLIGPVVNHNETCICCVIQIADDIYYYNCLRNRVMIMSLTFGFLMLIDCIIMYVVTSIHTC